MATAPPPPAMNLRWPPKLQVAVCIGAGIGVTPFSSVLKSIWYRVINPSQVMKLRKVYFFWVCRDTEVRVYCQRGANETCVTGESPD